MRENNMVKTSAELTGKNILRLDFGDNDFCRAMEAFGENLLENMSLETIHRLYSEKTLTTVIDRLTRHSLASNHFYFNHNYDTHRVLKDIEGYMTRDYFAVADKDISFIENMDKEDGDFCNSEVLFVDFLNRNVTIL